MMEFQDLIVQLKSDCRTYHFCQDGKKTILSASSVIECIALLREDIVYCFDSQYHDAVAENVEKWYERWKLEFNQCGIYVNENSVDEKGLVIWTSSNCCRALGRERVFVFGTSAMEVLAIDRAKVYSKNPRAKVLLGGHTYGFICNSCMVSVMSSGTCYAEKSKIHSCDNSRLFLTDDCDWKVDIGHKTYEKILHVGFQ